MDPLSCMTYEREPLKQIQDGALSRSRLKLRSLDSVTKQGGVVQ